MKRHISKFALSFTFLVVLSSLISIAQAQTYPGKKWKKATLTEDFGFDSEKLAEAKAYSETINTAAVVIVRDGIVVDEWGEVDKKYMTHSMRKSFLSALYGNYVKDGTIDLDKTMASIGIDDEPPLTQMESSATIRDCLKARTGIYHDALYESQGMKDLKPKGMVVRPGTFWYYNNWDFNAAGTIFEKLTGKKIFEAIEEDIAKPIQMESFEARNGWYVNGEESIHPAYPFHITAHDCARFGLLMLRKGKWNDKQIIPEDWVEESTRYHSDATLYRSDGYGYMWWVVRKYNKYPHLPFVDLPEGTYSARGAGGHYILVIPEFDLVIVHRVDTYVRGNSVSTAEFAGLVHRILEAMDK